MEKSKVKKQVLFLIIHQHGPFTAKKLSILPRSLAVVKVSNNKTENAVHSYAPTLPVKAEYTATMQC